MNKYTFLVTKLAYSNPVILNAASEDEAYEKMSSMLLSNQVDFGPEDESDFSFEIDNVEPLYTPMSQQNQNPPSVNGYTPMSSVRPTVEEEEEEGDEDGDEEADSTYVPMSSIKQKESQKDACLESSLLLLKTIESLAEEVLRINEKTSELESVNKQLLLLARNN
jgi:hypothetical protein